MNHKIHTTAARAILALAMGLPALASAQAADETGWYATGSAQHQYAVWGTGPDVSFRNGVGLKGRTDFQHNHALSLTVGKEMRRQENNGQYRQWRLEGELWGGDVRRNAITLGAAKANVNDSIEARALFVNALTRFHTTEYTRWWAGVGAGYGRVSYGDVNAAMGVNCNCLGETSGSGLALRAKVQAEALLSKDTALFYEFGYVRLPSAEHASAPSTRYGAIGITHGSLGLRKRF